MNDWIEIEDRPYVDLPELQIVPVEYEREIDRWPAAIISNPPIDSDGNFRPWPVN